MNIPKFRAVIITSIFLLSLNLIISGQTVDEKTKLAEATYAQAIQLFQQNTGESLKKALQKIQNARRLFLEVKEKKGEANSLYWTALIYIKLENTFNAIEAYEQALTIYQSLNDKKLVAQTLSQIAILYSSIKKHELALSYDNQALESYRQLGDKRNEAIILTNLAVDYYNLENKLNAIKIYLSAINLYIEIGDNDQQIRILLLIGNIYDDLGNTNEALNYFRQALSLSRKLNNRLQEAQILQEISGLYLLTNEKLKSLETLKEALLLFQSLNDKESEASTLLNIGNIYSMMILPEKAVGYFEEALKVSQKSGSKEDEYVLLLVLSGVYSTLGQKEKALECSENAAKLSIKSNVKSKFEEDLEKLLPLFMNIGQVDDEEAMELMKNALSNFDKNPLRGKKEEIYEYGMRMMFAGFFYASSNNNQKALEYFNYGLAIARTEKIRELEILMLFFKGLFMGESEPLTAIEYFKEIMTKPLPPDMKMFKPMVVFMIGVAYGGIYEEDPKPEYLVEAFSYLNQGAILYRASDDKNIEAAILYMLMQICNDSKQPQIAIFYGKQAVNLLQNIRGELKDLDQNLQDSYLQRVAETYHDLAEILINQGRFAEAQQVLEMLKEEEYFDYVRRDADEIKKLSARADLRADERVVLGKYEVLAGKVTEYGTQFEKLEELKNLQGTGFKQQKEYYALKAKLDAANAAFRIFLDKELTAELGKSAKREIEIDRALQAKLQQWGHGTVALYTVAGDDRYRVILTTPKTQIDGKTEIKIADLNKKIFEFRAALQNPAVDPRPLGKELYDILIKPIEKDLTAAEAKTLLWSLDGTLRYIPFAALSPDGTQYLTEKYQNVVITSTTRQSLLAEIDPKWRPLGAGVTKESHLIEPNGVLEIMFSALPEVKNELLKIVSNEDAKTAEYGLMTGRRLIDEEFNLSSFENGITQRIGKKPKYNIIHLATHFRLGGDTAKSFLLMGNNQALTLEKLSDDTALNFGDVELVTLSACNTGFSAAIENKSASKEQERRILEENNGAEVDSLATFIELRGAKAVLASLWSVADESTQMLMSEFYRLRKENPQMTKAEAMQFAQKSMIKGELKSSDKQTGCRSEIVKLDGNKQVAFKCDTNAPFAHPYYWSGFILIGNWR